VPLRLTGLWRNPDFLKLWAGQTVSAFGTLLGALQLTAILVLDATAFQVSVLTAAGVAPSLVAGLAVGAWVDRLPRRPVLVAADLGRAAVLASVPAVYFLGVLRVEHLWAVAFINGLFTAFVDVAYPAYLPSLVSRNQLIEANSKLSASTSVVEAGAFSVGGWIAQLLSAIVAVVIDAASFLLSGLMVLWIRKREPPPSAQRRASLLRDVVEGLRFVWRQRLLRALASYTAAWGLAQGMIGATITLYGIRVLGIQPGVLGTIYAIGGVSSLLGAMAAVRLTRRFGLGPMIVLGGLVYGLSMLLVPAARGPVLISALFMAAQQLVGDGAYTVSSINQVSMVQSVTPGEQLGRVTGSLRFVERGLALVGALLAGILAETIGLRLTLLAGAGNVLAGGVMLWLSPVRRLREAPSPPAAPPQAA